MEHSEAKTHIQEEEIRALEGRVRAAREDFPPFECELHRMKDSFSLGEETLMSIISAGFDDSQKQSLMDLGDESETEPTRKEDRKHNQNFWADTQ